MSFPKHLSRKHTGVELLGDVPEHWHLGRFKQILVERNERSESGEERLLSVSSYTGVSPRDEIIDDGEHLSRAESLEGYKLCYANDLVMNIMLAWNRGLAFTDYDGIVSPSYCVFTIVDDSDPKFLNYLVRSNEYTLYFEAYSSGVIKSRLRLYPDTFGQLTCGLPPLDEQKAISSFLDVETSKIDGLVSEQRRLIELLKEKRQAVISHAVTKGLNPNAPMKPSGIQWLGDVPQHWSVLPLHRIVQQRRPITYGIVQPGEPDETGRFMIRNQDFTSGWVSPDSIFRVSDTIEEPYQRARMKPNDLIMTIVGAVGAVGIIPDWLEGANTTQNLARIAVDETKASPFYVAALLQGPVGKRNVEFYSKGAVQATLNLGHVRRFWVTVPPLNEQTQIVEHINDQTVGLDGLEAEAERAIELLQERRTALISAAVTGKIDVHFLSSDLNHAIVKRGCRDDEIIDLCERIDYIDDTGDGSLDGWY